MSVRRHIISVFKFSLAIGLISWLLMSGRLDFRVLAESQFNWYWFAAAFVVYGLIQWLTAIRWRWLLAVAGQKCSILRAFLITLTSLLFNQVLIGSTGGDIYRVMAFDHVDSRQRIAIAVSVAADRLVGLYALLVLVPTATLWNFSVIMANEMLILVAAGSAIFTVTLPIVSLVVYRRGMAGRSAKEQDEGNSRIRRWLRYSSEGLALFSGRWPVVLRALALSLLIQAMIVGVNIILAFSIFGTDISWPALFLLIPVALLVMAVPFNPPGAIGTGEAMYSILLEFVGIAQGSIVSLLQRVLNILWALPGALVLLIPASNDMAAESESNGLRSVK